MRAVGWGLVCCLALPATAQEHPLTPGRRPRKEAHADAVKQARKGLRTGQPGLTRLLLSPEVHHAFDRGPVLSLLAESAGGLPDPEAHALWAHALASFNSTEGGDAKLPRNTAPADDAFIESLTRARALAAKEVAGYADDLRRKGARLMGSRLGARWAAGLAWELMRRSPQLVKTHGPALNKSLQPPPLDPGPVLAGLEAVIDAALARDDFGTAVEAARVLQGFVTQAGFQDLQGPRPTGLGGAAAAARRGLRRGREKAGELDGPPLTLEQLEAMSPEERTRFTREHASFKRPGVAVSHPDSLYRIETNCGFETLLGVVRTAELHHHRLVSWYGNDPCEGAQGIIRVVPQGSGLEAEGAPYWWAGGFQSGDATFIKFSVGTIEKLGRTLTHELTHRFDGRTYGGLPGWLSEGRAVCTETSYAHSSDTEFVPKTCNIGRCETAYIKQYGQQKNLENLLNGNPPDYRDNYTAGYALWIFLTTYPVTGEPKYLPQVEAYCRGVGRAGGAREFASYFADGRAGRAKGLRAFTEEWAEFLRGFYWQDRADWVRKYAAVQPRDDDEWVYDAPTWHRARAHSEPWFGQGHARAAARIFAREGKPKLAAMAYAWSLEVDEWDDEVAAALSTLLHDQRAKALAWVLDAERETRRPPHAPPIEPGPAPFVRSLSKLTALLETYDTAVAHYSEAKLPLVASAIAADRNALARRCRLPLAAVGPVAEGALLIKERHNPYDEPGWPLGYWGWREDGLTDFEDQRVAGLWCVDDAGDLVVGENKPPKDSALRRAAPDRQAFARAVVTHGPGRYLLSTRIAFLSSFVKGAVVVGWQRREQHLRFEFTAGDQEYAAGRREAPRDFEVLQWNMGDRRSRDGGLHRSAPRDAYRFAGDRYAADRLGFRLELLVDGPEVHAFVEGEWVGSYHRVNGLPLEGAIGFAVSRGSIRVERPSVRRLDRSAAAGWDWRWPRGLEVDRAGTLRGEELLNRRTDGIPVHPNGTLVAWFNPDALSSDPEQLAEDIGGALGRTAEILKDEGYPLALVAVVPKAVAEKHPSVLAKAIPPNTEIKVHQHTDSIASRTDPLALQKNLLLLVDERGVLRAQHLVPALYDELPAAIEHWAKVIRGRK